jgi:hypothetical protein
MWTLISVCPPPSTNGEDVFSDRNLGLVNNEIPKHKLALAPAANACFA